MEITRELLTGNITLTLEVSATPDECDHPARYKVIITPQRLEQIHCMAAIVREHMRGDLNVWLLRAWDYSGDWLNGTWDTDDGELQLDEQEPERMECDAIVVSDDDLHWAAYIKNCDIYCETESVMLSALGDKVMENREAAVSVPNLLNAAEKMIAAWENGDLAGAVCELAAAIQLAKGAAA